jgi:hypothetical protein
LAHLHRLTAVAFARDRSAYYLKELNDEALEEAGGSYMRKILWVGMILVAVLAAIGGSFSKGPEVVLSTSVSTIEVSCPDAEGCFSLLGEAIQQAPAGATIRMAPGIYYEKPLIIDKSLRIEGVQTETGRSPRIVLVDVGTALLIQGSSQMVVELQGLAIEALALDPFFDGGESIGVGVFVQTPENVQVTLTGVRIRSHQGIIIGGDQPGELSVEVVDANILAARLGIAMSLGRLILRESELRGPPLPALSTPFHGVFLQPLPSQRIEAVLTGTRIEGFSIGLMASASSELGQGRVDLQGVENVIASNRGDGLYFAGDRIDVELSRNEIRGNGGYGLKLALPECTPEGARPELKFQGLIQGTDNSLSDNKKGDLCPQDYPWPEGFRKP